jgi:hypothetical protein
MIKESGKELSKEFIEGDADKKARMLGQAVGEVLLALVSTKGVTAAVDAIKAGIKSGELASWFSKFSKGTATAEDIANGLGKTAEAVDKADDSVKIIGNIEGSGKVPNLSRNVTKVSELDENMLDGLKNEGTITAGGRSGGDRPLTGTANSYVTTDAGHTLVYDGDGRLIYDISTERVKMTVWDKAPDGNMYPRDVKLEGPVPNGLLK